MVAEVAWSAEARDRLHNLDLNLPKHQEIYNNIAMEFMMRNEIYYTKKGKPIFDEDVTNGYPDINENFTIGIGFNTNRPEARHEWNEAFKGLINFDAVVTRKRHLKIGEVMTLFKYSRQIRIDELKRVYKNYWDKFKPNEKLMIEDAYFNGKKLVGGHTKFAQNIKNYVDTEKIQYLQQAVYEIRKNSNNTDDEGMQKRRDAQAEMLESYKSPLYSRPNQSPIPDCPVIKIKLGETIIPRDPYQDSMRQYLLTGKAPEGQAFETSKREGFYIWRTQHDEKVRSSHKSNDGKIFRISHPPRTGNPAEEYGCRCIADYEIPIWLSAN